MGKTFKERKNRWDDYDNNSSNQKQKFSDRRKKKLRKIVKHDKEFDPSVDSNPVYPGGINGGVGSD